MEDNPGELTMWRFAFLSALTYGLVRVVVDTFIIPINWNWAGLLLGAIIFALVFILVLQYRERKKQRKLVFRPPANDLTNQQ